MRISPLAQGVNTLRKPNTLRNTQRSQTLLQQALIWRRRVCMVLSVNYYTHTPAHTHARARPPAHARSRTRTRIPSSRIGQQHPAHPAPPYKSLLDNGLRAQGGWIQHPAQHPAHPHNTLRKGILASLWATLEGLVIS